MVNSFIYDILLPILVFLLFIGFLSGIALFMLRRAPRMTHITYGAIYETLSQDNRAAVEVIVETKAKKKCREQKSGDPSEKAGNTNKKPTSPALKN
jgi:hypothetical protein